MIIIRNPQDPVRMIKAYRFIIRLPQLKAAWERAGCSHRHRPSMQGLRASLARPRGGASTGGTAPDLGFRV